MSAPGKAWLVLEDGTAFPGRSIGAPGQTIGEVVFNTAMTGYQEILTDPSYHSQIVCMTYPHIGNYGVNEDDVESSRPWVAGLVVREASPIASSWRAQLSLEDYLVQHGVLAIDGIDTRALTLKLRRDGAMKGGISTNGHAPEETLEAVRAWPGIVGVDLVKQVTCARPYEWPLMTSQGGADDAAPLLSAARVASRGPGVLHIVVIDYGVKFSILRQLAMRGCYVSVVPATMPAGEILSMKPDGIVLSNGPGDPSAVTIAIATIQQLVGQAPLLGICLGHQLLGLALGGKTFKLKFGHHGANHPIKDLSTGTIQITSQNHGFAVDPTSIPDRAARITHENLNDHTVEGLRHRELPIMSLQYHPEASPGPHDARPLFDTFLEMVKREHG